MRPVLYLKIYAIADFTVMQGVIVLRLKSKLNCKDRRVEYPQHVSQHVSHPVLSDIKPSSFPRALKLSCILPMHLYFPSGSTCRSPMAASSPGYCLLIALHIVSIAFASPVNYHGSNNRALFKRAYYVCAFQYISIIPLLTDSQRTCTAPFYCPILLRLRS